MNEFLKNNPFIVIESEATDENPFAENEIRFATAEEFAERALKHLQDGDFVNILSELKDRSE